MNGYVSAKMSQEQLSLLLDKIKNNSDLREQLKSASDFDAALAIAKDAGFDVTKEDWLQYQGQQTISLSDQELSQVAGGGQGQDTWADGKVLC